MNVDIAPILNDCIDRLAGGESVEACLRRYPQCAAELEPLLRTAATIHSLAKIAPDPARKEAAKKRFREMAQRDLQPERKLIAFSPRVRATAACLTATFLLAAALAGAVAASTDSIPDEPLYPVKRAAERVQLLFARDGDETYLHLEMADRRLNEMATIAYRRGVIRPSLLAEVFDETDEAVAGLDGADDKEKLGNQLLSLTSRQQEILHQVEAKAPEEAKEGLGKAIEKSRQSYKAVSTAVAGDKRNDRREDDERRSGSYAATATVPSTSTSTPKSTSTSTPTSTPTAPVAQSTAKAAKTEDEDSEHGRIETVTPAPTQIGRTPTSRAGTPTRSEDDDVRREATKLPASETSPTKSSTPLPTVTRTPTPRTPTATQTSIQPLPTATRTYAQPTPTTTEEDEHSAEEADD